MRRQEQELLWDDGWTRMGLQSCPRCARNTSGHRRGNSDRDSPAGGTRATGLRPFASTNMNNSILSRVVSEAAVDEVEVHFDWRPAVQDGCVVFQADIVRGGRRSAISFEVDLHKLSQTELE